MALNYIHREDTKPPQTLLKAIHQLKRRDDVVVTKPDKGSGVVFLDKDEHLRRIYYNRFGRIKQKSHLGL